MNSSNTTTVSLAPGKYAIGDLCYVLPCEMWQDMCNRTLDDSRSWIYANETLGSFMAYTAHGDGGYYSAEFGFEFGVDSGTIGITRIVDEVEYRDYDGLVKIIDSHTPVICDFSEEGVFKFSFNGSMHIIDTCYDENSWDYEDESSWGYDDDPDYYEDSDYYEDEEC